MKHAAIALLAFAAAALLGGCDVEEFEGTRTGEVVVSAVDDSTGQTLDEATVVLGERVPRTGPLPMVFTEVPEGESIPVRIQPTDFFYPGDTLEVDLVPPEVAEVTFHLPRLTDIALLRVRGSVDSARVLINEAETTFRTPADIPLAPARYTVSLYKPGHATLAPSLRVLQLAALQDTTLTFQLEATESGPETGDLVPDFSLPSDFGPEAGPGQYRGFVLLVNFWFYDCTPCRLEFPEIEEVAQERAEDGFRVLGVNTGWGDEMEQLSDIREELELTFPLVLGNEEISVSTFEVTTAPANFLVGPDGVIEQRFGATTAEDLNARLDQLLGAD